ncbi:hypothetical protein VCBJG01_3085 [Vibrio cholerae BJG-01]|nr:hypothetical protein VCBJG01_3085 [Vibrio cholerae BJG-01]
MCLSLVVMRCQPFRRALCLIHKISNEPRWLQLLCLSLVVMRCQPLRRAL